MSKNYDEMMIELVNEYGAEEALNKLIVALKFKADHYSDLGIKNEAIRNSEIAYILEDVVVLLKNNKGIL